MKTFKLIVTRSENSTTVLKYIKKCIKDINRMGVRLKVDIIESSEMTKKKIAALRQLGIQRLPALITNARQTYTGVRDITKLFEKNLKILHEQDKQKPRSIETYGEPSDTEIGSNPDLSDYWMASMFDGKDSNGKWIPRKDADEGDDPQDDISKKMRKYQENIPKHRKSGGGQRSALDDMMGGMHGDTRGDTRGDPHGGYGGRDPMDDMHGGRGGHVDPYQVSEPRDNISVPDFNGGGGDDEMDKKMLEAWLDNNPSDI